MKRTITDRIDNITKIPAEYACITPPAPHSVKIELTARCDFSCWFCATHKRLREKSDIDFDFYCRIIKEMHKAGVKELGLFYLGESFLYPRLAEAIQVAKDVGFEYVFLTTNGKLATKDRVAECFEAGLDSLKFSFNNATPEQFEEVTRVRAKFFPQIAENIRDAYRLREEGGYNCGIFASSIRYDGEQLTHMEEAVSTIIDFVDEHYWLPLYGQAGLTAGEKDSVPVAGNPGRLDAMRDALPCWACFTEGHITYEGRLSACCFGHEVDSGLSMGDLNTESFMDCWNSEKFQKLREANLAKDVTGTACETCIAYH